MSPEHLYGCQTVTLKQNKEAEEGKQSQANIVRRNDRGPENNGLIRL